MPMPANYFFELTMPSGNTYKIVDEGAREMISELLNFHEWLGITTTPLSEGATTNPITIDGQSVTAVQGDVATYQNEEFVFSSVGTWQKFGDLSGLGALAYKNTASGSFTPAGTCSGAAVTMSKATIKNMTNNGTLPSATMPTFTMNEHTLVITDGTFSAGAVATFEDKTVATDVDSVTQPTFTGTQGTVTVS